MKVVQAAGWYFPDSTGGTETYVDALARGLAGIGVDCAVAAPTDGETRSYRWNDIPVFRYRVPPTRDPRELRGMRTHAGFRDFEAWLREQSPDVYHQHSWTRGCGRFHLAAGRDVAATAVFTVHVPGVTCMRGTMMEHGREPCDGRIGLRRCARCWAGALSPIPGVASLVGAVPMALSRAAARSAVHGRLANGLAAKALAAARRDEVAGLGASADRIVAVCEWLRKALVNNGVASDRVVLCRQGVEIGPAHASPAFTRENGTLRVGFLGRITHVKGLHVLIEAVRELAASGTLVLRIGGQAQSDADRRYENELRERCAGVPGIEWLGAVAPQDRNDFLASLDVLAVPSQWMETGPLVVLEAHARGVPVIGSAMGGIAELVSDGVDGLLIRHDDVHAWHDALSRVTADRGWLGRLRAGIGPVRTVGAVVDEARALYESLLA